MSSGLDIETLTAVNVIVAGGDAGVRDLDALQTVITTVDASVGGMELYPSYYAKAVILARCIALLRPFLHRNTQTAWIAATSFLGHHGIDLRRMPPEEALDFIRKLAAGHIEHADAVDWFLERRLKRYP